MKAVKDNKVYNVDEVTKSEYLAKGFDIVDDNGNLIERSPSSIVSRKEYDELLSKYNELFAKYSELVEKNEQPKKKGKSGGEPDVSES